MSFHTNWSVHRLIWLICAPSPSQKELLSEIIWWDCTCLTGLLHLFSSLRIIMSSCGFYELSYRDILWLICSTAPWQPPKWKLITTTLEAELPFPTELRSCFHIMNNALIGLKIFIYLMEKHLVPFPELIWSIKHEIKGHMSGCKVVWITNHCLSLGFIRFLPHIPHRLWIYFTQYLKPEDWFWKYILFSCNPAENKSTPTLKLMGLSNRLLSGWKMHRVERHR